MASSNETVLSFRPAKPNVQQISHTSSTGGQPRGSRQSWKLSKDDRMLQGTGRLIKKIDVESSGTHAEDAGDVMIKNYRSIASYSWKDVEHPTIYVPGLPPKFTPPMPPVQLKRDNSTPTKTRSPAAAVDPLFQTLLHQHPDFDMSSVALVTDRNSLRNFLSFASGGAKKWRVDVDMIHDTMFFNQWEVFRLMMINGQQDSGFGHAFEDCVTTREAGVEDSIHHERIVSYELGGLECLVRFEADAYMKKEEHSEDEGGVAIATSESPAPKPSRPVLKPPYKQVHVISRGHDIDSDLIAEIKSSSTPKFNISKTLPQLWFSQTRHLCIGYHENGLVTKKLEIKDMSKQLQTWQTSSQQHLKNMVRVIREVRDIAKTANKCVIICNTVDGVTCLSVYGRQGADMAIRPEVVERFWRGC